MSKSDLLFLTKHVNQHELRLEKYKIRNILPNKPGNLEPSDLADEKFPCFQKLTPAFTEPIICTWAFASKEEIKSILDSENLKHAKKIIKNKLCHTYPKEGPRIIITELLYTAVKFAKTAKLSEAKTATLLSLFYLTHFYFTSSYAQNAEDVYYYFKDILTLHSLDYPPKSLKIFEPIEAYKVFHFFCKVYLRHLPIIRLLSLPNFGFELDLTPEPLPVLKKAKKKGGKEKKGKKKKKK